ncbi:MAG: two-component system sensor histidine kinase NtrB, partial [Vicinamibacteria bacterium]
TPASPSAADDLFFRHLVGNMRNGVLAIARDGHLVLINPEACRIFGLPPDGGYVGRAYQDVLAGHADIVRVLSGAFELEHLPNRAELRLKPTDKVIGYTLSLVRDEAGDAVGAALFFKDLTRVEQLEERERLRDRLAAIGEMAAAVAHEIKNPLAGIEVMAGLLRRQVADNRDAQALIADIIGESKMANAIVQEILDFVRPVRLQLERTFVSAALQNAVTMADGKGERGGITVRVDVSPELPPIQGDRHQLVQVFANLLANAYEALDGRGTVTLSARLATQEDEGALALDGHHPVPTVVVDVVDDGPGIDGAMADRIFNPFFTTKPKGSGLGLAIVRKIVDAHDGRIDVSSTPGRGTRFRVSLPVSSGPALVK